MKNFSSKKKVAIIGIGCRFAGGIKDPASYWTKLETCIDGVTDVPPDRWNADLFYDPDEDAPGKTYVRKAAFLEENVYDFDYNFFNISRREALTLDPQQRLLLTTAYEALDDAGQDLHRLRKTPVGVFIGGFMLDNLLLRTAKDSLKHVNAHTAVAGSATLLSNRISHVFDFTGPSITIDTACSASLAAIHLACRSILNEETELALAGGVNVMLGPAASILMCKGKFLARDGRSKAFFEQADGYGRGEGSGIIVLKELDKAIADNDAVYAIIESTAVNQDGRTDGISLPKQASQVAVMQTALQTAGIDPSLIDYVEAHGTGTKAGDPIEIGALGAVYGAKRKKPLLVGSVKANIGHTEAAAGVAGVIKAALMLKHGSMVPHMNLGRLSPGIPFQDLNIQIPVQGGDWHFSGPLKYAAVNSFGYGGTNSHTILSAFNAQPAVTTTPGAAEGQDYSFLISGKTAPSLKTNAENLLVFLEHNPDVSLPDLAYTLTARKTRYACNWLLSAGSRETLLAGLREKLSSTPPAPGNKAAGNGKLVWVFTGMGPQWYGMGQELYKTNTVFRAALDKCDALYNVYASYSLLAEMQKDEATSRITKNYLAQAANFFIQIGLSELLDAQGVPKDAIVGHSVGEVAAAVVAKAITLEDGIKIIYHRGQVLEEAAGQGTLLSVGLGVDDAKHYIRRFSGLEIAAINAPGSVAVAGRQDTLEQLDKLLTTAGIFSRFVRVEVAYHSSQLNRLKEKLMVAFSFVKPSMPACRLYSTVNGAAVEGIIHTGDYWWKNVREPVRFQVTLEKIMQGQYTNFIEIGPHPVLGGVIREIAAKKEIGVNTFFTLKRKTGECAVIARNLEELMEAGVPVACNPGLKGNMLRLPAYAWDKEYCWTLGSETEAFRLGAGRQSPFLQEQIAGPGICWKTQLNKPSLSYLKDHRIGSTVVFPGAAYIAGMLDMLSSTEADGVLVLEQVSIDHPLSFQPDEFPELYIHLSTGGACSISSRTGDTWTRHAKSTAWATSKYHPLPPVAVASPLQAAGQQPNRADAYRAFASAGLHYQHYFQTISGYTLTDDMVYARLDSQLQQDGSAMVDLTLLDGAFQSMMLLLNKTVPAKAYLPVGIHSIKVFKPVTAQAYCVACITDRFENTLRGNLQLVDATGQVLLDLQGLTCRKTTAADNVHPVQQWIYKYTFRPYDPKENGDMQHMAVIVTGDQDRFNCLARFLETARYVPAAGLSALSPEDYQLIYLPADNTDLSVTGMLADCHQLIQLLQGLPAKHMPRRFILLLDHGLADETKPGSEKINMHHASLTGFGRSVMTEMPDIQVKLIDIQHTLQDNTLQTLLQHAFPEEELIWTAEGWQHGVLIKDDVSFPQRNQTPVHRDEPGDCRLEILQKGRMESLQFRDFIPDDPGPHEVQIDIAASSVNFKDVMKAMGMLNEAALEHTYFGSDFGLEGAGVVCKVNETVKDIRCGDRVYFLGHGLRTKVNVHEHFVFKLPDHISFHEAATFLVYFTAWVALVELARLQKEQRVLIHSAAGGVGLAACRIAQARGAVIFATAGTDRKRALLEKEGIRHVYDSRSLNFYDEILHDTAGKGVDLVLNSLAGPALFKSLELLGTLGTFIEIGKQDITNNNKLPLLPFNKSIRFISLDLDKIAPVAPEQIRAWFQRFTEAYTAGVLPPLLHEVYKLPRFREGFRQLATGTQAGKIVIDFAERNIATVPVIYNRLQFAANDCVLITGGSSGFGLRTALWLAARGARHLVLGSRRGGIPPEEAGCREALQALGCRIYEIKLDVTDSNAVQEAVQLPAAKGLRLTGVIHAAAVLEDCIAKNLTPESFNRVYLPKVQGALHLHEATKEISLQFFICYASVTSYVGNPGQIAYATANALLGGLVHERRKQGLNATSVSWGPIAEVGMLARNEQASHHLQNIGFTPIPPQIALDVMEKAVNHCQSHVSVIDVDWDKWVSSLPGTWTKLAGLLTSNNNGESAFMNMLAAHDVAEWDHIIMENIIEVFSGITGNTVTALQPGAKLADLGLDSLMSVELSIALQSRLGLEIPMMEILSAGSINKLTQLLKEKILKQQPAASAGGLADRRPAAVKVRNLVNDYLTRICVGRPYFSLTSVQKTRDGLAGEVHGFHWNKSLAVNMADSARHLALLGSCVAADANPDSDRVCYPVQYADFRLNGIPGPQEALKLYARLLAFDRNRSRCEVYTAIRDSGQRNLVEMTVHYHVIPEKILYKMFEAHINTNLSWQDITSRIYEGDNPVSPEKNSRGQLCYRIDNLRPEQCVGHFSNLPAFPVSVMTRYAAHLIEAERQRCYKGQTFKMERVTCETERFAFAGEDVLFTAWEHKREEDGSFHWVCEITVDGKKIARMDSYEKAVHETSSGQDRYENLVS